MRPDTSWRRAAVLSPAVAAEPLPGVEDASPERVGHDATAAGAAARIAGLELPPLDALASGWADLHDGALHGCYSAACSMAARVSSTARPTTARGSASRRRLIMFGPNSSRIR